MHLSPLSVALCLGIALAASEADCQKKTLPQEDDWVSLLQLPKAQHTTKRSEESSEMEGKDPYSWRMHLVNKINNLNIWYQTKLANAQADLASFDARYPGLAPGNASNATGLFTMPPPPPPSANTWWGPPPANYTWPANPWWNNWWGYPPPANNTWTPPPWTPPPALSSYTAPPNSSGYFPWWMSDAMKNISAYPSAWWGPYGPWNSYVWNSSWYGPWGGPWGGLGPYGAGLWSWPDNSMNATQPWWWPSYLASPNTTIPRPWWSLAYAPGNNTPYWANFLGPAAKNGAVPPQWLPKAMESGYRPMRDNWWKVLVYGNIVGPNATIGDFWPGPYGYNSMYHPGPSDYPPYGPSMMSYPPYGYPSLYWGDDWDYWGPMMLTAKTTLTQKKAHVQKKLAGVQFLEDSDSKKVELTKALTGIEAELAEVDSKYTELLTKSQDATSEVVELKTDAEATSDEAAEATSEATSDEAAEATSDETAEADAEANADESSSPLGLSGEEGESKLTAAPAVPGFAFTPEESAPMPPAPISPLGLDGQPGPAGFAEADVPPEFGGGELPPVEFDENGVPALEFAAPFPNADPRQAPPMPTMSEAQGAAIPAGPVPQWPAIEEPPALPQGDVDFTSEGATMETDATMNQGQYLNQNAAADMTQGMMQGQGMAGGLNAGMMQSQGMAGGLNAGMMQGQGMAGGLTADMMQGQGVVGGLTAGTTQGTNQGVGMMSTAKLSKTLDGSVMSGDHPVVPDRYLAEAIKWGYDPERDQQWRKFIE